MPEQTILHHRFIDAIALPAADATPAAQKAYGPCPQDYEWYIENVAYAVIGNSHTANLDLAITPDGGNLPAMASWDHQGLVWTSPVAGAAQVKDAYNVSGPWYVPSGWFIHAVASAGGGTFAQNDVIVVTFQIRVEEKIALMGLLSKEERAELAAEHQSRGMGEVTLTAVAEERAV